MDKSNQSASIQPPKKAAARVALFVILLIVVLIRIRLLNFPLERDEGEYAYGGQLLLQGVSPYQAAYSVTMKLPGTCLAYAGIMAVFGQTAVAIHLGILLVNLASALLVFLIGGRIYGEVAGAVAAGTFALLSIVPVTLGFQAHATQFVIMTALAGIALLQRIDDNTSSKRIFLGGVLLGLAVLMKQTGAVFGLFAAAWILWFELSRETRHWQRLTTRLMWLAAGGMIPLALTCLILAACGEFGRFWLWAFQYPAAHSAVFSVGQGMQIMIHALAKQFTAASGLWALALIGFVLAFAASSLRSWRFFLVVLAAFSFLAVCPGWYFTGHYFIQLLPAAGLLAGAAFHLASGFLARSKSALSPVALPAIVFAMAGVSLLVQWNEFYFRLTPAQASRAMYGMNPFPEAVEISRYIASHTAPDARIAVIGSESEIFFYSQRRSATGHITIYPLLEQQRFAPQMRTEMISEIEKADPAYVVYVNVLNSWIMSTAKPDPAIFEWFDKYRQQHLELVGLVEILSDTQTDYRWFEPQEKLPEVRSGNWLAIFKNRNYPAEKISPDFAK